MLAILAVNGWVRVGHAALPCRLGWHPIRN
jgi:hypothetical protein